MKNGIFLAVAFALLTMLATGGTARADNDSIPEDFFNLEVVPAGSFYSFNTDPVPAGVLGDCDGFSGDVLLDGVELDPHLFGTTDTRIHRGPVDFAPDPFQPNIPIQLVELSLVSTIPITVNCGGVPTEWDMSVNLDSPANGLMNMFHNPSDPGGLLDFHGINACLQVEFVEVPGGAVVPLFPCRPVSLETDPIVPQEWLHGCGPGVLCGASDILFPVAPSFELSGPGLTLFLGTASEPVTATGTVIIKKEAIPTSGELFTFINGTFFAGSFGLVDLQTKTFDDVAPGSHTLTEVPSASYPFVSWECTQLPDVVTSGLDATATFEVAPNGLTLCAFTNEADINPTPVVGNVQADDVFSLNLGETSYEFTVEYSDDSGIDVSSIDNNDVTVTGPGGPLVITNGTPDIGTDGTPRTATYTATPPGGSWDAADNGTYTIGVYGNEVFDLDGAFVAADPNLATFNVDVTFAPTGTVIIEKVTDPLDTDGVFTFDQTIDGSGSFNLPQGGSKTFEFVPIGTYTVTEQKPTGGFVNGGWNCLGPDEFPLLPIPGPTASFEVKPGETLTCTVTNKLVFGVGVEQFLEEDGQVRVVIHLKHVQLPEGIPITEDVYAGYIFDLLGTKERVLAAMGSGFVPSVHPYGGLPTLVGTITSQEALDALGNAAVGIFSDVERVDWDVSGHGHLADTVPLINADQWHADGVTGEGVLVAVIDSGIDTDHADLADDLVFQECFGDSDGVVDGVGFCPGGSDRQTGIGAAEDDQSHGSHVTGIVTSKGTVSPVGVAPGAEIVAIKVLDNLNNFYYFSEILAALNFVIVNKPVAGGSLDVELVNMSLGTNALFDGDCDASTAYNLSAAAAVNALRAMGVTVFASSGNNGSTTSMSSPACLSEVVSVGATDDLDNVAAFTNSNASTDLMAPGVGVVSTDNTGSTAVKSGTSMASPHAVGCAALLIDAGVVSTPAEVEARLKNSSVQVIAGGLLFPRIDCRIPSDRPSSVGGATSFLDDGSRSALSAGVLAIFVVGAAGAFAVLAAVGWYGRRRWLGEGAH